MSSKLTLSNYNSKSVSIHNLAIVFVPVSRNSSFNQQKFFKILDWKEYHKYNIHLKPFIKLSRENDEKSYSEQEMKSCIV